MTKCNKILLCAMLAVVMTLACALTVLPAPPGECGDENGYCRLYGKTKC